MIENLDKLIADSDTSDNGERETLEQYKAIAESLLKIIDEAKSPQTGDNSILWLWMVILFVSGSAILTISIINKKKNK